MNHFILSPKHWILLGIPCIFLLGSLFHFLYELTGNCILAGLISPVNESIWEHTKLGILPIFLWWGIYYFFFRTRFHLDPSIWFTSCLFSILVSILTTPLLFYFYTQAFGFQSLAIDIFLFFLAILFGQLLGLHCYKYHFGISILKCILCFSILAVCYFYFTFNPPKIPLFQDSQTLTYGIFQKK